MKHPDLCWVHIPTDNSLGIVKWTENGYYKTDYPHNYSKEIVDEMNKSNGFSREECDAMVICSMANLPETDEAWAKHYEMVLKTLLKHK